MINGKKIIVIMPAYNAEKTLEKTYLEIPFDLVDEVILTDDASRDRTVEVANKLGISVLIHENNLGYGANQKTCYNSALERGADYVIMLHPDYQYSPKLIPEIVNKLESGDDLVLGSRMKGMNAIRQGMPIYKFISNSILTSFQNIILGMKLSEYHTGYRAYRKNVLEDISYADFSNDFIFDNQLLMESISKGFKIGEIYCPARYEADSSSINFRRSLQYGLGVIALTWKYRKKGLGR